MPIAVIVSGNAASSASVSPATASRRSYVTFARPATIFPGTEGVKGGRVDGARAQNL